MYSNVVIEVPSAQATRNSKFIAMLQCNRGYTHRIATGRTEREARDNLNATKAQNILAKFS